mmetsp:Transcript_43363/g.64290  ORF Transcript_43363/g.64290 Transcript_43363/m.64290 type:complete len:393 (-) Transcript_43363:152-1330(-)|eukprot:CAMPEP_0194045020 /NCGR_PEP_ID=MMETSP0009_2-20130614/16401_1 /TAXON_ID=210454 /ORGANISM="Grammatophora oceanica, Strain CCMP 410" /LENGTH=392 /DNA_ID=CAMNT_0038689741 /DNA_START=73 /DNA_END=1251 /DNA_ORIENTATION=-
MSAPPPTTASSTATYQSFVGKPSFLSTESYGILLLLLSSLLYSCMAAFVKLASSTGIPSIELVFLRGIFQGAVVVAAMFYFVEETPSAASTSIPTTTIASSSENKNRILLIQQPFGASKVRIVVILRGAIGGMGFLFFYYTFSALPLGDATALLNLSPIITVVASSSLCLGEEPFSSSLLSAAVTTVFGSILIARPNFLFHDNNDATTTTPSNSLGYITALLGSLCSATVILFVRKAGKMGVHTLQLLFSWCFFAIVFSSVLNLVEEASFVWPSSTTSWIYILGLSLLGSMAHFLMNYAGRLAPASVTSIIRSSSILWGYVLEMLVFDQIPMWTSLVGAMLICTSLVVVATQQQHTRTQQDEKQQTDVQQAAPLIQEYGTATTSTTSYGSTA